MPKVKNSILVVDDTPENLKLLGELIESDGHDLRIAINGQKAIEIAKSNRIDLILLDIMMPEMDGYEVCKLLKEDKKTARIPVIFLTALDSLHDETRGFELGAVDYITKPFKLEIVRLRVNNHLSLANAQKELKKYSEKLEDLVAERTEELRLAHQRLVSLDSAKYDFLQLIYRNLWAPYEGLIDIAREIFVKLRTSNADNEELSERFETSQTKVFSTINNALLLAGTSLGGEKLQFYAVRLDSVLGDAIEKLKPMSNLRRVNFSVDLVPFTLVLADIDLLFHSLTTILHASILLALSGATIKVESKELDKLLSLQISINSVEKQKLPDIESLFNASGNLNSLIGKELGLNVSLTAKIINSFEGAITIQKFQKSSVLIELALPKYQKKRGSIIDLIK